MNPPTVGEATTSGFSGQAGQAPAMAGTQPPPTVSRLADREIPAPKLARTITVFALSWYATVCVLNVAYVKPGRGLLITCAVVVLTLFGMQLAHSFPGARQWPMRRRYLTLGVQAVLTYLPFLLYGLNWGSMAGPLAGSVLLLVPGVAAWIIFGLITASSVVISLLVKASAFMTTYFVASTVLAGLVIYSLTRLADLVAEVHASRGELARMAVAEERIRFSRDLHDLLGYSLSAITLKTELIYRLVPARPDRAREEIASVLDVSRQALSDVRLVASGYRDMSLEAEAASAASILAAADVRAEVDITCGRLHPLVDTVLATALREGITNILRHSKVQACAITAAAEGDTVRLTLVNDGVDGQQHRASSPHSGSGLGNLQTRLTAIGGRVEAGTRDGGRFQLAVEAPARPKADAATPQGRSTAQPAA